MTGRWEQSLTMNISFRLSHAGRSNIYRAPFQTSVLVFENLPRLLIQS